MNRMILFCIPHAGGSASLYRKWALKLNENIKLYPLELKGRGELFNEEFYANFDELLNDLYQRICNEIKDGSEYMIFGHSMGAYATYMLENMLETKLSQKAKCIFVSGREAPEYWEETRKYISKLNDDEFLEEVKAYGGIQEEILKDKDMLDIFLPILKNDFRIIESIKFNKFNNKLSCKIIAMNGINDCNSMERVAEWKKFTSESFDMKYFEGGHFYINNCWKEIVSYINLEGVDQNEKEY